MRLFLILSVLALVSCQHSLTDKCYVQYWKLYTESMLTGYQYFINTKGVPVSRDWINHEYVYKSNKTRISCSYYYHYLLTCEKASENEFSCDSVCDSVWYKYVDEADNLRIKEQCGKKFHNKYRNVVDNPCVVDGEDIFRFVKEQIGKKSHDIIKMDGKKPALMEDFYEGDKCDVDYEILGLWTVIIVIISSIVIVFLLLVIAIWVYAQKHRTQKRARLQSSLIQNENKDLPVLI